MRVCSCKERRAQDKLHIMTTTMHTNITIKKEEEIYDEGDEDEEDVRRRKSLVPLCSSHSCACVLKVISHGR